MSAAEPIRRAERLRLQRAPLRDHPHHYRRGWPAGLCECGLPFAAPVHNAQAVRDYWRNR